MKIRFTPGIAASLQRCFRSKWHPIELWYRFICWLWRRYSTVKPRWLDHTWCDRSELMAHAMFEVLGRFIEQECSPGVIEWYGRYGRKITVNGESKYVRDEMCDLWDWWRYDYLAGFDKRRKAIDDELEKLDYDSALSQFDGDASGEFWTYNPQYKTPEAAARAKELLNQLTALEAEQECELQLRLHRLIDIREHLWT